MPDLTPQEKAHADAEAARLVADWISDTGPVATTYRDITPVRPTGAQPVTQPGRTPMSQKATDASALMLAAGAASLPAGGSLALVLWVAGGMSPLHLALVAGAPVALVTALGITAKMLGRAVKEGAEGVAQAAAATPPGEVHHHHTGTSYIENRNVHVNAENRWLGKTHNEIH